MLSLALWGPATCTSGGDTTVADIYNPSGQLIASLSSGCYGAAMNLTLTNSGVFTILVHESAYRRSVSYQMSIQSITGGGCNGTAIACGQTVAATTTDNSQMDPYSYLGTAGQMLSLALWGPATCTSGGDTTVADIYNPSGQLVASLSSGCSGAAMKLTLTSSGIFTILVHESAYRRTVSYQMSLQSLTGGGCNGDSIFCGETVNGQISYPSEMIGYEMVANAGEHVLFSDGGFSGMVVDIYDPTGSNVVSIGPSASTNYTFADTGIYTVVVHDGNYTGTGSYGLTLTVFGGCSSLPTDSLSPTNQAVPIGSAATFTATASGPTPLFYQWWFGANLITGATNATFTIANVQTNELGLYEVYVNNPGGAVSNSVRLQGIPVITWAPSGVTYGTALGAAQLNATANVPGSFAYFPTNGSVLNSGANKLTNIFTPTDTVNYVKATNTVILVVSPAPLTVTATNKSKIYGQTISFSGVEFTTLGLVNGDTVTSAAISSAGSPSTAPVNGSPYTITITNAVGDSGLTNYNITYVNGFLTVNLAALSVTATGPGKTYGTALTTGTSTANFTATGMQNSETVTSVMLTPNAAGLSATTAAGTAYLVTPSAATGTINPNNYSITYNAYNGTVATAPLSVTATGPGKTYGTALTTGNSTANFTATGMQNSETVTSVTLTPNSAGLSATTAAGAAYVVTPSAATGTINPNNYSITYNAYNGTVTKAPLSVAAINQSKTYGQTVAFGSGSTLFTPNGLQNGDTIGMVTLGVSGNGGAATAAVSGSPYTITPSAATGGTFTAGNYAITYATGNLTVGQASLTITASAQSKTYGQTLAFGSGSTLFSSSALQNGETVGTVTLSVSGNGGAATASVAGSPYTITPSAATGGTFTAGNYAITYNTGNLSVNLASLTVTASAQSKTYGQTVIFGSGSTLFTPSGLQNGDTIGTVTLAVSGNGGASTASVAGSPYTITPSAATGGTFAPGNYGITYATGNLTVSKAPLTITANAQSKTYGQTVAFGSGSTLFTPSGLQNGETIGTVTLAVSGNGGAATASACSSPYTITPSAATGGTFTAGNYAITYDTGLFTVNPAPLTITAGAQSKTYGHTLPIGSGNPIGVCTVTGLENGDTVGTVTIAVSGNGAAATAPVSGSPYIITPSVATGGTFTACNYSITYLTGLLTIVPAPLTITANNQSKTYGQTVVFGSGSTLFTSSGLQNGETIGAVTLAVSGNGGAATAAVSGSPYTITPSAATGGTFTAGNYAITYATGSLTINPAPLTVTANDQSKTYGQTVVFGSGSTNFTSSGLQNGETIGTVTLAVSGNGGASTASVAGSPYTITPSAATGGTFTAGNYSMTYVTGLLTVIPLPLMASHSSVAYQSPGTCVVSCSVTYATNTSLLFLVVEPSLPPGWTLLSASGAGSPEVNNDEIFFSGSLPSPLNFTYTASVPAGQTGPQTIQDTNLYWLSGMTSFSNTLANPSPLVVNYGAYLTVTRQSNAMSLTLFGDTGTNYTLQASTNLINWTNVGTITPVGGIIQTNVTNTGNNVFFRAESSH